MGWPKSIIAVWVVLLGMLFAPTLAAQMQTSGEVIGTVTDPSGSVVPASTVTLRNQATGQSREAITDASGSFVFQAVVPGNYDLSVNAKGFAPAIARGMIVLVGQTTSQPFQLRIAGTTQEVTVTGAIPLVQTNTSDVGGVPGPSADRYPVSKKPGFHGFGTAGSTGCAHSAD